MARNLCEQCKRPTISCICAFIIETNNKTPVLVLQHPSEVKQSKGTVALLQRSLNDCQVLIGEDFTHHTDLNKLLSTHQPILLYPGESAKVLMSCDRQNNNSTEEKKQPLLIIIDGTWKKAYRMFMLSKNLHSLKQVCLPTQLANNGQYLIRKVAKKNALSSLEATCYALALLEGELDETLLSNFSYEKTNKIECGRYKGILNKFSQFNQFQLSFRK
jgi:DTW domain-containing protein YfiP